ncbi:MAG: pyridoxamine 5'-phosphate oxidase family protein [Ruminococcaceae bacterium]|nr:pyridoxamine 5'-phosphate oxidase family protein [Oscillospiraceae bacterium]
MFREMRRFKQQLSDEECLEILNKETAGVLALQGDDDYPYAVPLSYVYADNKIFFHGAKTGHKIDAINRNPKASFCVVSEDNVVPEKYTTYFRSVIAFGKMRIITDEAEKREAIVILAKKYFPEDSADHRNKAIEGEYKPLCMFVLEIEHLTGKEAIELVKAKRG